MLNKLKDDILRLLKEDEEFRYAVVGLLGLQRLEEAIARLIDIQVNMEARLKNVEEAVAKLSEDILSKLVDNVTRLADNVIKLADRVAMLVDTISSMESRLAKVEEAVVRLADIQARQEERLSKTEERLAKVEDRLSKVEEAWIRSEERLAKVEERLVRVEERLEEHDKKFNAILAELRDLKSKHDKRLSNIEAYMERTSLTLEEEAREVIAYRLRDKGIAIMNISSLILEDIEIDIYATDTNLCLIGEASTRVSAKLIEEVDKDIDKLCRKYPNYLKDKVIKVVYGMQVLPDAVDEARKRGIWLVTANKEITELSI
jgi:chromosome segregation ATPase